MRVKSVLFGSTVALVFFILTPLGLMTLNSILSLPLIATPIGQAAGLIFFILGFLLFLYCSKLFILLGKGTPVPIEPPNKLVSNKLYQFTRNPIYISYFMMFFGMAFFFGHSLLFLYALLSMPGIHLYVIRFEEPGLARRFGKTYAEYCQTTPRWIRV